MPHDAVKAATKEEILSGRALTYRRTILAMSLIAAAIAANRSIDFSNLNLFGVRLSGGGQEQRALVLRVIWLLLLYHAGMFTYYAARDFRTWRSALVARPFDEAGHGTNYFPFARMYVGLAAQQEESVKALALAEGVKVSWSAKPHNNDLRWTATWEAGGQNHNHFRVPIKLMRRVRWKLVWFFLVDVGVPALALVMFALLSLPGVAKYFT